MMKRCTQSHGSMAAGARTLVVLFSAQPGIPFVPPYHFIGHLVRLLTWSMIVSILIEMASALCCRRLKPK